MQLTSDNPLRNVLLALAWCAFLFPASSLAQNVRFPENSIDSRRRSEARVDPLTRAVQISVPLGSYPGRGGTSLPVVLNYSSKVWQIRHNGKISVGAERHRNTYDASYAPDSAAGWTSTLDWARGPLPTDAAFQFYDLDGRPVSGKGPWRVARLYVRLPDGSQHELRRDDNVHQGTNSFGNTVPLPGVYYAVDGSRLRYDTATKTLYLPDGSRFYETGGSGQITRHYVDRNGNTLTYDDNAQTWTDTLGRVIGRVPLPDGEDLATAPNSRDDSYALPGVNGTITYILRWRRLRDPNTGATVLTDTGEQLLPKGDRLSVSNCNTTPSLFTSVAYCDMDADDHYLGASGGGFNPLVLHQIELPNGTSYTFTYNRYGEITKVVYPTGGYEKFEYGGAPRLGDEFEGEFGPLYGQANRGATARRVAARADGADEAPWAYQTKFRGPLTQQEMALVDVAPDGTRYERWVFRGLGLWVDSSVGHAEIRFGFGDPRAGMPYEECIYAPGPGGTQGPMIRRKLTELATDGQIIDGPGSRQYRTRDPRTIKEVNALLDTAGNALTSVTSFSYDADLNLTATYRHDFTEVAQASAQGNPITSFQPGPLLTVEEATYLVNDLTFSQAARDAYRARNMTSLPSSSRLKNAAGDVVAQSEVRYDESAFAPLPCGATVGWSDPGTGFRGMATTKRVWVDTPAGWLATHARYDACGSLRTSWDARDTARVNPSQIEYSAAFHYAYPTRVLSAVPDPSGQNGSSAALSASIDYDFSTGLATSVTDANDKITSYQYNDPLNRLKRVERPDGGYTAYTYDDQHQCGPYVAARTLLDSGGRETTDYQFFDGLGRPARTFKYDPQDPNNLYQTSDTQYDTMGRVRRVSNPYRSSGCFSPVNLSGRWIETTYDALGRATHIKATADNAQVVTVYSGNTVRVADQAGNQRMSVSDAMGRLTRVVEDPFGLAYQTDYYYDALGNLRKVKQGGQLRYFMYDSLSRLIRAKNPEHAVNAALTLPDTYRAPDDQTPNSKWTISYSYDANSNLHQRTDARGVTTTYDYDRLNRNTTVTYSDGTPAIKRVYDGATNGRGRFFADWTWDGAGVYYTHRVVNQYDELGRPRNQLQYFYVNNAAGTPFTTSRTYDLAGNVKTQTYPSGHAVSYNYDAAGRLADNGGQAAFSGNLGDGVARTYSAGVSYDEGGGLRQERFGTATPLYHKRHHNVRGQLYDVRLSTVEWQPGGAGEWDWNRGAVALYYGGAPHQQSSASNNGNVTKAEHWVPANDQMTVFNFTQQTFAYDALNRLSSVTEQAGSPAGLGAAHAAQAYTYDRWGNRQIDAAGTWLGQPSNSPSPLINETQFGLEEAATKNQLLAPGDASKAGETDRRMRYDAAGNLIKDTYTGGGARAYDAENRMTGAWGPGALTGSYYNEYRYDADGRRVRRKVESGEVWQVYGFDGELLAEYQAGAATILATKEFGYRGGELLVTAASGDDGRLLRFLHKLYNALGRSPSAAEQQAGMATLSAAAAQGRPQLLQASRDLAASLFNSTEYALRGRTDAQFVNDLYWTYPQRKPDPGGHQAWLNAIPAYGRAGVRDGFAYSPEFDSLTGRVYGLSTGEDQRTELYIHKLYTSLGRSPSAAELSAHVARVNTAAVQGRLQTIAEARTIGRELFLSQEYANRGRSDRDFVYDLYVAFLDREPDAGGWDAWTNAAALYGRTAVLDGIAGSGEFDNRASTLYRETFWLVKDHLGTPRMAADRSGTLAGIRRHDYLPFGDEVGTNIGGRTAGQGYSGVDNVRQKFTGYERDGEIGLEFAQARYYSNTHGRFTSVDPYGGSVFLQIPQSWNRYTYCINDPVNYIDPSGMIWVRDNDRENPFYIWVPDEDYREGNQYYDDQERYVALDANEIGPNGVTFTLTEGRYTEVYPELVGREVFLGGDGRLYPVENDPPASGPGVITSTVLDISPPIWLGRRVFAYDTIRSTRQQGHRILPGEFNSAQRHSWASERTALQFGVSVARDYGTLNEIQGFIWHDVWDLPGRLSGQRPWAFQLNDLNSNEEGFRRAHSRLGWW